VHIQEGNGFLFVAEKAMQNLDLGIRYRVIRKAIQRLKKDIRDIDFAFVKRFSDFIDHPSQTNLLELGSGLRLWLENEMLYLLMDGVTIPVVDYPQLGDQIELSIPWQIRLQYGWHCTAEVLQVEQLSFDTIRSAGRWDAWLDLDQVTQPVTISTRVSGERFSPLGGEGHSIKISDLFINHKIPTSARKQYPLIKDTNGIIWAPGIQIAERVRVTNQTRRLLRIQMRREGHGLLPG
jgi:tRNA(Ile)-lysidine synthase